MEVRPSVYLFLLPVGSQAQSIGYADSQVSCSVVHFPTSGPLFPCPWLTQGLPGLQCPPHQQALFPISQPQ